MQPTTTVDRPSAREATAAGAVRALALEKPVGDRTIDHACEHFIEFLTHPYCHILVEGRRVLRVRSLFRVSTPNLPYFVDRYLAGYLDPRDNGFLEVAAVGWRVSVHPELRAPESLPDHEVSLVGAVR